MFKQIKTTAHDIVARVIFIREQFQLSEQEMYYEQQIAKSQAKIGPLQACHHPSADLGVTKREHQ